MCNPKMLILLVLVVVEVVFVLGIVLIDTLVSDTI